MLSLIILFPLIGALLLTTVKFRDDSFFVKTIPIIASIVSFILNVFLLFKFDASKVGFQFVDELFSVSIGVDGISILMMLLTTFLFPLCIILAINHKTQNLRLLMALFMLLESLIVGVFTSLEIISFYIFFEAVLIPMFFIIGIWGHKDRVYAALKLFLYTLCGSLLFLVAVIYIYNKSGGINDIQRLSYIVPGLSIDVQKWLWLAFFISFAIKVPMVPFHTWLPDAHVQAPTIGSVVLAGVLIKMGAYGFLRFSLPMLPDASLYFADFVVILSIVAVVYTSLVAFAQTDIKKLIAYSSVAHMGFVTAGIFSFNEYGISGAIFQMISHGLVSAALFLCVGMLYSRTHTLEINKYGGLAKLMPNFSVMFILFSMASIGLPGTSGFIGEFLPMLGVFCTSKFTMTFLAMGMIGSAIYMLYLCRKVIWGICSNHLITEDINRVELCILILLSILVVILGLYPHPVLVTYLKPVVVELLVKKFHL